MGFTTQISQIIKISILIIRITVSIGSVKATPVKSYVDVTNSNFYLLELLDALKDFKKIPDLNKSSGIKILSNKLKELNSTEINLLIKYSLAYPPRARSLLGANLEKTKASVDLTVLKNSLNPLSEYELGIASVLSTAKNWNIKWDYWGTLALYSILKMKSAKEQLKKKIKRISKCVADKLPETEIEGITNKVGKIRKTSHS